MTHTAKKAHSGRAVQWSLGLKCPHHPRALLAATRNPANSHLPYSNIDRRYEDHKGPRDDRGISIPSAT
ncbi:MAG: hypothetical protein CM15mP84_04510 [Cellvibrionales bacterium]|nr:MAG: hypothetical protein CM15mP84_04510 [Cellvibrionales bacterium]